MAQKDNKTSETLKLTGARFNTQQGCSRLENMPLNEMSEEWERDGP